MLLSSVLPDVGTCSFCLVCMRVLSEVVTDLDHLTGVDAPVCTGTTLSVLRVDGLMGQGCRMFDSPGVPHSHQLTALLTLPEVSQFGPSTAALAPRACSIDCMALSTGLPAVKAS